MGSLSPTLPTSAGIEIDWTTLLPQARIKAMLQENSSVGILPKQTMDLITAASALFVRDLMERAKTERGDVDLQQPLGRQHAFLSDALADFYAPTTMTSDKTSSSLLGARKRPPTKRPAPSGKKKKAAPASDDAKLSKTMVEHASQLVAVSDPNAMSANPSRKDIELDEEDYD
jgi:hypothetical protein